jgi:hypothetical protein
MSFTRIALETHYTHMSTGVKFYRLASILSDIFKANRVTCKTDVYKCGTNKIYPTPGMCIYIFQFYRASYPLSNYKERDFLLRPCLVFYLSKHCKTARNEMFIIFFCWTLSEFENFLLCERILINVTTCQNETSS